MKAFSDRKLTDRQVAHSGGKQASEKEPEGGEFTAMTPEELYQTQTLIQDLDKQFTVLREALQHRQMRIAQVKRLHSELQLLLFPPRRPWWRRWLPW
jgi:hypothetical protein